MIALSLEIHHAANEPKFEKVVVWQLSQVNWSRKALLLEISIAKELVTISMAPEPIHAMSQTLKFSEFAPLC